MWAIKTAVIEKAETEGESHLRAADSAAAAQETADAGASSFSHILHECEHVYVCIHKIMSEMLPNLNAERHRETA